jgi:hypothetical protein
MKRIVFGFILLFAFLYNVSAEELSPFVDCGYVQGNIKTVKEQVESKLKESGFTVTGSYKVENKDKFCVITFTNTDLQNICLKVEERGILAANLRIGLIAEAGKVHITALNPKYLFVGYLRGEYYTHKSSLVKVENNVEAVLKSFNRQLKYFGGKIAEGDLKKYHYMMGMPYFDDPVTLKEFNSFEKAVSTIENNLLAKKSNTQLVYKLVYTDLKRAVFGVALYNKEMGEEHFLPIIGETHIAAMPYEIVVMGNKATMLHGRFWFAFYWPELSMSEFTKIMSTPGDVEDMLESLCE